MVDLFIETVHDSVYHSTRTQALDFIHTCTVALACTTHCAHGRGGAVEEIHDQSENVPAT